jgi:ADP-heptose:LPS heptosyltransferase
MVISSGGNKLISVLLWLTGIKKRYGYDTGVLSRLLLTKAVPLNKNQYAAAMYHDLVTPLTQHKTPLPEINVEVGEKIPNSVLIHPGVSKVSLEKGMVKTIPAQTWVQIIDLLAKAGKKVLLTGGPDDEEMIKLIVNSLELRVDKTKFSTLNPQPSTLNQLAQIISQAEKFVCSDSAPLHIAVALKIKTYPVFGPTDDKKLIPQSPDVIPLKAACDCPIQPCLWEHRQTTCETLDCLKLEAQAAVNTILS